MTKKIKVSELSEFDPSKYLDDDEAVADYIRLAIEDGDPGLLAAALGDVARARGMTQVAQSAGLTREALYKALRADASPRFDTIQRVCKAIGVKLTAAAAT
jgi:probable addiction module antidote protein